MEVRINVVLNLAWIVLVDVFGVLGVFEVEPQSSSGIVPFGQQAVFYCKASQGFLFSTWDVKILNRDLGTNIGFESDLLRGFGIVSNISNDMSESYLIVNATEVTNNISIVCEVRDNTAMQSTSSIITTQFYGPPSAPTNLIISNYSNGQLHVVWDFSSTPGVETMFSLTVVKNNSYSRQQSTSTYPSLVNTTTQINVTFSFCDVLYLWVRASNNAGESEKSPVAMWIPPYQPSFSPLSLRPSLSKTDDGVFVTVAIQIPQTCQEYSQAFFDVVLENLTGTERKWRQKPMQETREWLAEDQVYLLHVQSNGKPLTSQQKIVTTDVQGVEVCAEDKALNIRCLFITGSTENGCGYILVGDSVIVEYIARKSLQGSRVEVHNVSKYNRILVYDASSPADFSIRRMFTTKSLQNLTQCPSTDTQSKGVTSISNNDHMTGLLTVYLPTGIGVVTAIFMLAVVIVTMIYCCTKRYGVTKDKTQTQASGFQSEEIQQDPRHNIEMNDPVMPDLHCDVNPSYEAMKVDLNCDANISYDVVGPSNSNNRGNDDVYYDTIPINQK